MAKPNAVIGFRCTDTRRIQDGLDALLVLCLWCGTDDLRQFRSAKNGTLCAHRDPREYDQHA